MSDGWRIRLPSYTEHLCPSATWSGAPSQTLTSHYICRTGVENKSFHFADLQCIFVNDQKLSTETILRIKVIIKNI